MTDNKRPHLAHNKQPHLAHNCDLVFRSALIEKLQYPDKEKEWQAYVLSLGLMVTGLMRSMLFTHSMNRSALLAMHIKTTLVGAIYKKVGFFMVTFTECQRFPKMYVEPVSPFRSEYVECAAKPWAGSVTD